MRIWFPQKPEPLLEIIFYVNQSKNLITSITGISNHVEFLATEVKTIHKLIANVLGFSLENEDQTMINFESHPKTTKSATRASRSKVVMLGFCS